MYVYKKDEILLAFLTHLQLFSEIGIALSDSLQIFANHISVSSFKKILMRVIRDLQDGSSFTQSLQRHRKTFPLLMVHLMAMAEATNQLASTCEHLKSHLLWIQRQKKLGLARLRYPLLLGGLLGIVMILLSIHILPLVMKFIQDMGSEIPTTLYALEQIGDFFKEHSIILISGMIGLGAISTTLYKFHSPSRHKMAGLSYQIPLLGTLLLERDLAVFSHILKTALKANLDLLQALQISEQTLKNPAFQTTLHHLRLQIIKGHPLMTVFSYCEIFPKYFQHFLETGLASNRLVAVLEALSHHYTQSYHARMEKILDILPPLLLLVMGSILTSLILILFAPLYDTLSKIGIA